MAYYSVVFVDDDESKWQIKLYGYSVLGRLEDIIEPGSLVLLGTGTPQQRAIDVTRAKAKGATLYTLIGPDVTRAKDAIIGEGSVLETGAILGPGSVIGKGALINKRAMVTHDAEVGDYCVRVALHLPRRGNHTGSWI